MDSNSPTPLCVLPCSVRFTVWCLRVARMSVEGSEVARQRLREVDEFLKLPQACVALERCVRLLKEKSVEPLDIREFGSVYLSAVEADLLMAFGWLQSGDTARAHRVLAYYAGPLQAASVADAAAFWVEQLKAGGVMLPRFEEISAPASTALH